MKLISNFNYHILKPIYTGIRHKLLLFGLFMLSNTSIFSMELGYNAGLNRIGINPGGFQPLYGFSIGKTFNKYIGIETNLIYSQRSIGKSIQADYLSFILMPKLGYFGKKAAVYYGPSLLLNPTLYHSNIENHTYLSTLHVVGAQYNINAKLSIDMKAGYDIGLSGAYFDNGKYSRYSGPVLLLGMKVVFAEK